MATYRQRGTTWTAQVKHKGKVVATRTFPTKTLAREWATATEAKRDAGTLRDKHLDRVTIGQVHELWSATRVHPNVKAATAAREETHWRLHLAPTFQNVAVADPTLSLQVQAWMVARTAAGVGAPTLIKARGQLLAICRAAVAAKIIPTNPLSETRAPEHHAERKPFVTVGEVDAILAEVSSPIARLILAVCAETGLRIQEVLGLRAVDVARDGSTLTINQVWTRRGIRPRSAKTRDSLRVVPVPHDLRPALVAYTRRMLPATLLFPGQDDRNLNNRDLAPACERAGVDRITVNQLRHHAASVWVAGGVPLFEVGRALGHVNSLMVDRTYGHLTPGAHDRLLAVRSAARA